MAQRHYCAVVDRVGTPTAASTQAYRAVVVRDRAGPTGGVANRGEYTLPRTKAVRLRAYREAEKRIGPDSVNLITLAAVLADDSSPLGVACLVSFARACGEKGEEKP